MSFKVFQREQFHVSDLTVYLVQYTPNAFQKVFGKKSKWMHIFFSNGIYFDENGNFVDDLELVSAIQDFFQKMDRLKKINSFNSQNVLQKTGFSPRIISGGKKEGK